MHPSTPPSPADRPYVSVTTKRWLGWATLAVYLAAAGCLFALGGHAILIWALAAPYLVLVTSYRRHRVSCTDEGIELRAIWWRKVVPWRDVSKLETRPKHGPKAVILTRRLDPPWRLVISSDRRRYILEARKSLAESMQADFERQRAAYLEQRAIAGPS
jgi:hypothetical protein